MIQRRALYQIDCLAGLPLARNVLLRRYVLSIASLTWNEFCSLCVYQVYNAFSGINLKEYLGRLSTLGRGACSGTTLGDMERMNV